MSQGAEAPKWSCLLPLPFSQAVCSPVLGHPGLPAHICSQLPTGPCCTCSQGLGPCTATLQPSAYPVTVETWAQVRIRNAAWAAAILTPRWQSYGSVIQQLGRLGLLCVHNSGTDAFRTGILIPLEFCHCELGVTGLWKDRRSLAGSHLGPVSGLGKEAHRGAEPVYITGTSLRVCTCSASILILKEAHFMGC